MTLESPVPTRSKTAAKLTCTADAISFQSVPGVALMHLPGEGGEHPNAGGAHR